MSLLPSTNRLPFFEGLGETRSAAPRLSSPTPAALRAATLLLLGRSGVPGPTSSDTPPRGVGGVAAARPSRESVPSPFTRFLSR